MYEVVKKWKNIVMKKHSSDENKSKFSFFLRKKWDAQTARTGVRFVQKE